MLYPTLSRFVSVSVRTWFSIFQGLLSLFWCYREGLRSISIPCGGFERKALKTQVRGGCFLILEAFAISRFFNYISLCSFSKMCFWKWISVGRKMYSGCCIWSNSFVFFVCSWFQLCLFSNFELLYLVVSFSFISSLMKICKRGASRKKSTTAAVFSISLLVFLCILVSSVSVWSAVLFISS
jgi:hypothetical protein